MGRHPRPCVALARECRAAKPSPVEAEEHDAVCRVLTGIVVHTATFVHCDVQYASQLLSSQTKAGRVQLEAEAMCAAARPCSMKVRS